MQRCRPGLDRKTRWAISKSSPTKKWIACWPKKWRKRSERLFGAPGETFAEAAGIARPGIAVAPGRHRKRAHRAHRRRRDRVPHPGNQRWSRWILAAAGG